MSAVILQFRRPEPQPQAPEEAPRFTVEFELPKLGMDAKAYSEAWRLLLIHAREAKAWCKYAEAKRWRLHIMDPDSDEYTAASEEATEAFERMVAFVGKVARAPIPIGKPTFMAMDLNSKRKAIGSVWMKAEGRLYDDWRACVAEDEARLESGRRERRAMVASR